MASSIREQVLAAAFAAVSGLAGLTVARRNPHVEWEPDDMPALAFLDGGMTLNEAFSGQEEWHLDFEIQVWVTGRDDAAVTAAVDARLVEIVNALKADIALGGLVSDLQLQQMTEPDIMRDGAVQPFGLFGLGFQVAFSNSEADVTVLA